MRAGHTKIFLLRKFRLHVRRDSWKSCVGNRVFVAITFKRNKESLSWRVFAVQEGSPQRGGSILCCCEERSRHRTFTAKSVKTVLILLMERRHNRLHSNWGKKTLRISTPGWPGSSLFKLVPRVSRTNCSKFSCRKNFVP